MNKNFVYYPVRCQCNKILANKQEIIEEMKKQGIPINMKTLEKLNINRACCILRLQEPAIQLKSVDFIYDPDPEIIKFFRNTLENE